ncbi:helix-turn-helix transcriptional regulator [Vogesella sp. LIG4]|uniref:helix-turn-helix domain-containing protein n=1 Tax=Vogesella sp. LIG4 TaxID=1192162 RepID=UPI00081F8C27|nr:helix-turn-helix transcriptional regulator [Vogesella sp. LIG4]SCK09951.1 transcriptional regulator, LuxR family [Vogesella sp. LIG4]
MEGLLRELPLHHGLAQLFEHLGGARFWRALVLQLRQLAPFDNALAVCFTPRQAPLILDESSFDAAPAASPMPLYCQGLYLLDPFYQLACEPFTDGLHHLPDIAPDQFQQSTYYLDYHRKEVGVDEVQFLLRLAPEQVLSLSLGSSSPYQAEQIGRLRIVQGWVLAAMKRHWQLQEAPQASPPRNGLSDQLAQMLEQFGRGCLSERESEIARLTLRGLSSKAIAQQLAISPETVKVHRRNMYNKLGVANHSELFNRFICQLSQNG